MSWWQQSLDAALGLDARAWLAVAVVSLAALGLLRRAAGPGLARLLTLPVLGVFAVAAWGVVSMFTSARPARWRWVASGAPPSAAPADVLLSGSSGDPGELALALAAGDVDGAALLWTAPIAAAGVPASRGGAAACAVVPLGFSPAEFSLRAAPLRLGRPAEFTLAVPVPASGEVRLTVGDAVVARLPFAAAAAGNVSLPFTPAVAGELQIDLEARVAGGVPGSERAVRGAGSLQVAPPQQVAVVGRAASVVAAALRAQQLDVVALAELPGDLTALAALVLLDPLPGPAQARVQEFVDAGGGVLLVGGPEGGALPLRDETWAKCSPVLLAARPQPQSEPREGGTPPQKPEPPPGDKPPEPPPPAETERPVQGDTSTAKAPTGPEVEVERRDVAMVFVIDRSASMTEQAFGGGPTRMEFVRSAAQATASRLQPADRLAIVTFGDPGKDELVLPLTPAEPLEPIHRAFAQLAARNNEGTYVDSALARAVALLGKSDAAVRHLVVITDGEIADLIQACSRVQAAQRAGVTSSLIRFGPLDTSRYTALCRQFVALGRGQYLHATDTQEVPALVTAEVKRVLGSTGRRVSDDAEPLPTPDAAKVADAPPPSDPKPPQPEAKPQPETKPERTPSAPPVSLAVRALAKSPLLAPIPDLPPPSLRGVLPVTARPEARVLLVAGPEGRPLLAFKNFGLGRVAAWSADLTGDWSQAWQHSPAFPAWLAQWLSAVLPAERQTQPADALRARRVEPDGPTPAMLASLTAWSGAELLPWPPTAAAAGEVAVSTAQPWAIGLCLWGAAALLLLLCIEFGLARRT